MNISQVVNSTIIVAIIMLFGNGCTTVNVDHVKHQSTELKSGEYVVIIGRRSSSEYETEPELVSCIGNVLKAGDNPLNVVDEKTFSNQLYPWFEPRTAPTQINSLRRLLNYQRVADAFNQFNVHYIIWVDGNTEKTRSSGTMNCGLSAGGAACFGFGTWDKSSKYEATIWDYKEQKIIGQVSSTADGTSYMPAIVVPIPLIAQVQKEACKGMAQQLRQFFVEQ